MLRAATMRAAGCVLRAATYLRGDLRGYSRGSPELLHHDAIAAEVNLVPPRDQAEQVPDQPVI